MIFQTAIGDIQGWRNGKLIRATGIPYAKADRYGIPEEVELSPIPFPAVKKSPACPQNLSQKTSTLMKRNIMEGLTFTEHCQYLSISLPLAPPPSTGRPVMVWIHGGSYTSGAGDSPMYDPRLLVEEHDLIVVNINYRLGILGFLGGYGNIPANLGLIDIIAALKWIKKHISSFGGDPENITLFGQSSGGDAIAHLMLADDVTTLFHKVIIQSAPLGIRKDKSAMIQKMISRAETLPKDADIDELLKLQNELVLSMKRFGLKGGMPFGVQYGHYPLPREEDAEKIWRERAKQWSVLIGWTERETSVFVPFSSKLKAVGKIPGLGKVVLEWFIRKTTDRIYRNPAKAFAQNIVTNGGSVYCYNMNWGHKNNNIRASHISDIALLFGSVELLQDSAFGRGKSIEELKRDGEEIRKIWSRFARTGNLEEDRIVPGIVSYYNSSNS
ncbi:carboxylesterase family protein [Sinomicrobium sp.]